jgi:prepilin-type N-terminal cleavage/methylation domain-containing protein
MTNWIAPLFISNIADRGDRDGASPNIASLSVGVPASAGGSSHKCIIQSSFGRLKAVHQRRRSRQIRLDLAACGASPDGNRGKNSGYSLTRRSAFSLIELSMVVLIMGIMAGVVVVSLKGHIDRARWTRSFEQLENIDRLARMAARAESTPYRLSFDRDKRKVEMQAIGPLSRSQSLRQWRLPSGIQFASFRDRSSGNRSEELRIDINPAGQSRSYAIGIKASSGPEQWLVTLGLSGQHLQMDNAEDVAAVFR